MHVKGHELVVNHDRPLQHIFSLWNERLPVRLVGPGRVNGNQPPARCVEVRAEVEDRAVVADESVGGFKLGDEFDDGRIGLQVFVKEAVAAVGSLPHVEHQVAAIVANFGAEAPIVVVGPLVDQHIVGLRRVEAVEIELLILVQRGVSQAIFGLLVARVVEARAVFEPGRAGEFAPLDQVGQIVAGLHLAHAPRQPVGAAGADGVGQQLAILARRPAGEGHRAVG